MTFYHGGRAGGPDPGVRELRWTRIYEAASAGAPRNRLSRAIRHNLDLLTNSGSLMATTAVTSVLGFAYWWLAARAFAPEVVGSASAAVSAMSLIGTLGMFGMGTLLIGELPRVRAGSEWNLISTCLLVAGAASTVGAVLYVAVAMLVPGLRDSLGSTTWTLVLVLGIAVNAMALVLDEGLVGLLAGRLQLMRNTYFAVGKLVLLALLPLLPVTVTGGEVVGTWVAGIVLSTGILALSLRRRGLLPSVRPRLSMLRGLTRRAFGHNALNVALFLPRTSLPLVVTMLLSTRATAGFYTAWMVFSFLAMIPTTLSTTIFAVASGDAAALRGKVRMALLVALGVGIPASVLLGLAARPIMVMFGSEYAALAAPALALLSVSYVPMVFRQIFVAVSRVQGKVRRATAVAVVAGLAEIGAAWYGGSRAGLTGFVAGFLVVVAVESLVMAPPVLLLATAGRRGRHAAPGRGHTALGLSTPLGGR